MSLPNDIDLAFAAGMVVGMLLLFLLQQLWNLFLRAGHGRVWRLRWLKPMKPDKKPHEREH